MPNRPVSLAFPEARHHQHPADRDFQEHCLATSESERERRVGDMYAGFEVFHEARSHGCFHQSKQDVFDNQSCSVGDGAFLGIVRSEFPDDIQANFDPIADSGHLSYTC